MSDVELIACDQLRKRQIAGYKFRRQASIGRYVVDFVCLSERLIVEIDGPSHDFKFDADRRRAHWLHRRGIASSISPPTKYFRTLSVFGSPSKPR
jgi:very-short-patch-repair endonuclease